MIKHLQIDRQARRALLGPMTKTVANFKRFIL